MPPKTSNRDEFSKQTKAILEKRAGGVCSNPDCKVFTSSAHTNPEKSSSIGVAAHICAAASGGPRFDSFMSENARISVGNGIWLCQSCSKLIDTDAAQFPVALLQAWKASAEDTSQKRIGQKSVSESEHRSEVMFAYGKGMLAHSNGKASDPTALKSAIKGHERSLSDVDPRFEVSLRSYQDGNSIYEIVPKPGAVSMIDLLLLNTPSVTNKVRLLREYGKSTELPPESYTMVIHPKNN
ncbi:MAG: hypothetical protein CML22_14210 [Rheinheimera sp.]|nr:hypothetical protein [Rheinheimera sp.]MBM35438.1 hypothetical protein [Rheinheimera sp.]|tara:strand:- start:19 stop:735 length:717 start_codon:yes stop_codon:yes gene_type:complete